MNELDKKLCELFQNEEFKAECENIQSVEELQKLFAAHGVDMTIEQVTELCVAVGRRVAQEENGELDEEALDEVTGGIAWAVIGIAALCIGAFALGIYNGING